MKYILIILFFSSCTSLDSNTKVEQLDNRVTKLENDINEIKERLVAIENMLANKNKTSRSVPLKVKSSNVPQEKTGYKAPQSKQEYSGQCAAITKKGTRCSRNARSNGYCWQHGG